MESPNGENEYKEAFFKQTNDIFRNLFEWWATTERIKIDVIKILQDDNTISQTILLRNLSRINLIHATNEAVKTKSKKFECV